MAYKSVVAACALVFLVTACQSTDEAIKAEQARSEEAHKPDWIKALPQHPDMIYGLGSSPIYSDEPSAIAAATESARVAVAKTIRVNINATTNVEQTSNNGDMSFYFNDAIENSVNDMELAGLEVSDSYVDSKMKTAYVLAEFNKAEAIVLLQKQIAQLDNELASLSIDFSADAGDKLSQAIYLKKRFAKRKSYNAQLENLRVMKVELTSAEKLLLKDIDQVFNSVTFAVFTSNEPELQSKLIAAITAQGIRVNNNVADFYLTYQVKWRDLAKNDLFYSIVSSTVSLKSGDVILKSFQAKAKGSSSDKGLAKDKAIEKLARQFADTLSKELFESFDQVAPSFAKTTKQQALTN